MRRTSTPKPLDQNQPRLTDSIRSFLRLVTDVFQTRLELLTLEIEDEGIRLAKLVAFIVGGLLCLFFAYLFVVFFVLVLAWNTPYCLWVIGFILLTYLMGGLGLLLAARSLLIKRPPFLLQTLSELRQDVAELMKKPVANVETPHE